MSEVDMGLVMKLCILQTKCSCVSVFIRADTHVKLTLCYVPT